MSDDVGTRFEKLNDGNYGTWCMMMRSILIRRKLWKGIIDMKITEIKADGTMKTESEIEKETAVALAKRDEDKLDEARAEMILRVEPGQLAHMESEDPREVWQTLQDIHRAQGFATSLALRRKFMTSKMKEGQSMSNWIGQVRAMSVEMKRAKIVVTDLDIILSITLGLPPSFEPIVISFDAIPSDELSLAYVTGRLLNDETRQEAGIASRNDLAEEAMSAMRARSNRNGTGGRTNAGVNPCQRLDGS